ncbi:MAG: alanine--tRNA ligase [Candidatus Fischerbacteria bacterium RBG_13_37_8]|uniref:Alanine--tRNA ligase n=1 Tax=Candidatus Fischerbacteria bacterium RBG_13_37_8 TaxID=1817863 RepID=A0A1F5V689_9BACT|nr:MAG: alanine--tRNA ligase [Candidatus Fischerbacteria bacterium RBG_13_37_8]
MRSTEVRETFLRYFENKNHKRVMSSSLIPANDPTLLFTNAGMNQFKDTFLGQEKRNYIRATSCQKCVRAGGKHNDLENVGKTNRHHTFFEMLGNFSFGDYFKQEAIEYAWDLLLNGYRISPDRLWVSIYEEDEEAYQIWHKTTGISADRIIRLGMKDNFWAMGETGPCGPCSEIYYDQGEQAGCGKETCGLECDCERYLEFWNLVFMQYNRDEQGIMHPLPSPSIDTGMGLERIVALLQGKTSNYDTDLFMPLIEEICELANAEYANNTETSVAIRVAADHSRAVAFLIAAGIIPSNEGRGYVLRRIIRRASRYGKLLHLDYPYLYKIAYRAAEIMGNLYSELLEAKDYIAKICYSEEERYHNVVSLGIARLEELIHKTREQDATCLPGNEVFKLYDTFGLPLDLIEEIASEQNIAIDYEGYNNNMQMQKVTARAAWKKEEDSKSIDLYRDFSNKFQIEFLGYERTEYSGAKILSIIKENMEVSSLKEGERGELIIDKTVFYGESGGQVGDKGIIKSVSGEAIVEDTQKPFSQLILHIVTITNGELSKTDTVDLYVNKLRRETIMRNHTATHLLNASLRQLLGTHVKQSGSLVSDEKFRFDFTHFDTLSPVTVKEIEKLVNEKIYENLPVEISWKSLEEAIDSGALAFFGEKYEDHVRVMKIGNFSKELCGGTHCSSTGQIGCFILTKVSSIAAGIRRIEAVTGALAFDHIQKNRDILAQLSEMMKIQPAVIPEKIKSLLEKNKEIEKELEQLRIFTFSHKDTDQLTTEHTINDIKIVIREIHNAQMDILRELIDEFRTGEKKSIGVFGSSGNGKASIVVGVTPDISNVVSAAEIIKKIAPIIEGGGGGRKDFAQAGGKKSEKLKEALDKSFECIEKLIKKQ